MLSLSGHDRQVLHLVAPILRSHPQRRKTSWRGRREDEAKVSLGFGTTEAEGGLVVG